MRIINIRPSQHLLHQPHTVHSKLQSAMYTHTQFWPSNKNFNTTTEQSATWNKSFNTTTEQSATWNKSTITALPHQLLPFLFLLSHVVTSYDKRSILQWPEMFLFLVINVNKNISTLIPCTQITEVAKLKKISKKVNISSQLF